MTSSYQHGLINPFFTFNFHVCIILHFISV